MESNRNNTSTSAGKGHGLCAGADEEAAGKADILKQNQEKGFKPDERTDKTSAAVLLQNNQHPHPKSKLDIPNSGFGSKMPNGSNNSIAASVDGAEMDTTVSAQNVLWPPFLSTYDWKDVHEDLENGIYSGCYGWDHAAYWGIAEKKAGIDLHDWYKKRTEDEFYLPQIKELIDNPKTQESWKDIFTFDPMGMYACPPTIAACKANLDVPELYDGALGEALHIDGKVVREDGQVAVQKAAIYYSWNLPRLSERLNMPESELRDALYKYSRNPDLLDPNIRTYIPAVGGCTIYMFGDPRKIRDPRTEIAVRVHDECIGSDV